jgi:PST family polysaccharide transporter
MSLNDIALAAAWPAENNATAEKRPDDPQNLAAVTLRGGLHLALRYGLGVLIGVANMLVLTWWIGPHAYGVFVTAIGIVAFLATLARCGIDTYLVRCDGDPEAAAYGTATILILGASLILTASGVAITPLLIRWFGNREFLFPYLTLLLIIPISGLTGVPMASLERALDFRRIAAIELASQSAGLVTAASLAWLHAGVWAPVLGQISWQLFTLVAVAWVAPKSARRGFDLEQARRMLSYGLSLTTSLRVWQLRTLVNPLLVGRLAGTEAVAFVALGIRIAESLGTIRLAAGRIAIATLAKIQNSQETFSRILDKALFLQVVALGPPLCAFAVLGPMIVRHLIGIRWVPSLLVYPFVAAGVLVNSVYNLQASALFVIGKVQIVTKAYILHVALLVLATAILLPRMGIPGYGWAELAACLAYFPIHAGLLRRVSISYRRLAPWMGAFAALLFSGSIFHWTGYAK